MPTNCSELVLECYLLNCTAAPYRRLNDHPPDDYWHCALFVCQTDGVLAYARSCNCCSEFIQYVLVSNHKRDVLVRPLGAAIL